jgi:hypothetical protein
MYSTIAIWPGLESEKERKSRIGESFSKFFMLKFLLVSQQIIKAFPKRE